ncbi:MAG: dynamin family protein [Bacillota bacterium]
MVKIVKKILEKSPAFNQLKDKDKFIELKEITENISITLKNYNINEELKIGVVGEVKSGKSTLINSLINEDASPIGITETTGSVIKFRNTKRDSYIEYIDGNKDVDNYENIKNKVQNFGSNYSNWENVSVINFDFNNSFLESFELIDTPGLQTLNKKAEKITEEIFNKIDIILWVFNYTHYDQLDIQDKLEEFIEKFPKPIVAIINKTENVSDKKKLIKDFNNDFLFFDEIKEVIPMSALNALSARKNNNQNLLEESGINNLINYLDKIKDKGSKEMKYKSNKELLDKLIGKYVDFHEDIIEDINIKKSNFYSDLKKEKVERKMLLNGIKSYKDKVRLCSPEDIFENQINEVYQYIDNFDKTDIKKENIEKLLKNKLEYEFNEALINKKANIFMNNLISELKLEIEENSEEYKLVKNSSIDNEISSINENFKSKSLKNGIGLGGISATAPAFFEAVLGSQAASVTFLGALPQFVIPGIAIGAAGTYIQRKITVSRKKKIKKDLHKSFEKITKQYKKQLFLKMDNLEDKLENIYQEKVELICISHKVNNEEDFDIKINQIEKFISNFNENKIHNLLFSGESFENLNLKERRNKYIKLIEDTDPNIDVSETVINKIILDKDILNYKIFKIELEQKFINLKKGNKNINYIYLENVNNLFIIKLNDKYKLVLDNIKNPFYSVNFDKLNSLKNNDFVEFYRSEEIINKENNGFKESYKILFDYIEKKLSVLKDVIKYEKDIEEIQLKDYLKYMLKNYNNTEDSIENILIDIENYSLNKNLDIIDFRKLQKNIIDGIIISKELKKDIKKRELEIEILNDNKKESVKNKNLKLKKMLSLLEENPSMTKRKKAEMIINITALTCSLVAIQPIPFADIFILSPLQTTMAISLNKIMKNDLDKANAKKIVKSVMTTIGWGFLSQQTVLGLYKTVLPFMGAVTTIPLVYASTYALGKILVAYFDKDNTMSKSEMKRNYKLEFKNIKKNSKYLNPMNIKREMQKYKTILNEYARKKEEYEKSFDKFDKSKKNDIKYRKERFVKRLKNEYSNIYFTENYINNMFIYKYEKISKIEREYNFAELNEEKYKNYNKELKIGENYLIIESKNNKIIIDIISSNKRKDLNESINKNKVLISKIDKLNKDISKKENEKYKIEREISLYKKKNNKLKKSLDANEINKDKYDKKLKENEKVINKLTSNKEEIILEINEYKEEAERYKNRDTHKIYSKFIKELNSKKNIRIQRTILNRLEVNSIEKFDIIEEEIMQIKRDFIKIINKKGYFITNTNNLGEILIIKDGKELIYEFKFKIIDSFKRKQELISKLKSSSVLKLYNAEKSFFSQNKNFGIMAFNYIQVLENELHKFDDIIRMKDKDPSNYFEIKNGLTLGTYPMFIKEIKNHSVKEFDLNKLKSINNHLFYVSKKRNNVAHTPDGKDEKKDFVLSREEYENIRIKIINKILPVIVD